MATNTMTTNSEAQAQAAPDAAPLFAALRSWREVLNGLSPARVVAGIGLLALLVLLLAAIAGVAQAQVRKGQDFQFAQPPATPAKTIYSSRGGTRVNDLGPVAALAD